MSRPGRSTRPDAEGCPQGLAGWCWVILGIEGVPMTATDIRLWLEREGESYTQKQVHFALHGLARKDPARHRYPPLAEIAEKRPGRRGAAFWQQTAAGQALYAGDEVDGL